jgi:hypothetical protein
MANAGIAQAFIKIIRCFEKKGNGGYDLARTLYTRLSVKGEIC